MKKKQVAKKTKQKLIPTEYKVDFFKVKLALQNDVVSLNEIQKNIEDADGDEKYLIPQQEKYTKFKRKNKKYYHVDIKNKYERKEINILKKEIEKLKKDIDEKIIN